MGHKLYSLIILLCLSSLSKAQNLIAVEHSSSTTFHSSLDSALAYSSNGDNIYLPGGTFSATGLIIDKSVHIIGVGYNPDSSQSTSPTLLIGDINIESTASNGSIMGLLIQGKVYFNYDNLNVNNYKISRCYLLGGLIYFPYPNNSQNIILTENIIDGAYSPYLGSSYHSILGRGALIFCYNNIFNRYISAVGENSVFKNNIFLCVDNYYGILSSNKIIIENNVFFLHSFTSITNSSIKNNSFRFSLTNGYDGNFNFLSNNKYNSADSIFIGIPNSNLFLFTNVLKVDFRLTSYSSGKNAGTDGTDIGIYGGLYPWKVGGLPNTPHIQYKTLKGTTESDGKLKVNIKVKAQDN